MKSIVFPIVMILLGCLSASAQTQTPEPVAGRDYIEIPNGSPLDPAEGMVVVEEFFNYICPGCYQFEPQFSAWAAQLPATVKLVHVPASFRADFEQYAQAYYAAQTFDIVEETHNAIYAAIHRERKLPAEGDRPDPEKIAAFYANFGVDSAEFLAAMKSFNVNFKVNRGADHMRRSRIPSTPSIVINGRYLVQGNTFGDVLRTADYLIRKEQEE